MPGRSTSHRTPRGIMLDVLPLGIPDSDYGYAIGTAANGDLYVICTEGVGWPVSVACGFSGFTRDALLESARKYGTRVDLADFVRVFGDRLEVNFRLWVRKLQSA